MIVNLFDLLLDAGSESPYKTFFYHQITRHGINESRSNLSLGL